MSVKHISWTCTWVTEHSALVKIPDDADLEDYALYDALMQLKADAPENGTTREFMRSEIDWEDVKELSDEDEVEVLNLEGYKL